MAAALRVNLLRGSKQEGPCMFDFIRRIDERMRLMERMGNTTGASISDAVADGRLGGERLRSAVHRCAACTSVDACEEWMESHADGARAAPSYCRNRGLFAQLAGGS